MTTDNIAILILAFIGFSILLYAAIRANKTNLTEDFE